MAYVLHVTIERNGDTLKILLHDGLPTMWLNGKRTDWFRLTLGMSPRAIDQLSECIMKLYIMNDQLCKN